MEVKEIKVDLDWLAQHAKFERAEGMVFTTPDGRSVQARSRMYTQIEGVIEELRKDTYTDPDGYQHVLCYAVHSLQAVRAYEVEPTKHAASRYIFILTFAKWVEVS